MSPKIIVALFELAIASLIKIGSMQNELENPLDLLKRLFSAGETIEAKEASKKIEQDILNIETAVVQHFYLIENEPKQRLFIRNFHAQVVVLSDKLFDATEKRATETQQDDLFLNFIKTLKRHNSHNAS